MSDARRIKFVKQREPLRVPQHWNSEDRSFAIQLNGQLDEIYAKLGKIQQSAETINSKLVPQRVDVPFNTAARSYEFPGSSCYAVKYGNIVEVQIKAITDGRGSNPFPNDSATLIATLPEGFRPPDYVYAIAVDMTEGYIEYMSLAASGNINFFPVRSGLWHIRSTIFFIIEE